MQIKIPLCTCSIFNLTYEIADDNGNKSSLIRVTNCCSCSNPTDYNLGFPVQYNEDGKMMLLIMTIYFGFLNYLSRN